MENKKERLESELHCHDDKEVPHVLRGLISGSTEKDEIILSIEVTKWPDELAKARLLSYNNGVMKVRCQDKSIATLYLKAIFFISS